MSCPYDLTTSSSRSTFHMGKAVQFAAQDIMRQLKDIVVKEYGVPPDQVSFADGKGTPARKLSRLCRNHVQDGSACKAAP